MRNLISPLLYTVFLAGILLVFSQNFELFFRKVRQKREIRNSREKKTEPHPILSYVNHMLAAVFPGKKISAVSVLRLCLILWLIFMLFLLPVLSVKAVFPAIFFASTPILLLRFRLEKLRNRGSKEAALLVSGLLNHYRANHRNIYSGLEALIKDPADGCGITKKLLFRLLMNIRSTKNQETLRLATQEFAFGIKTNWSDMLSQCIFAAAYEGLDISEALEDILEQLKTAKVLEEERKLANSESTRLVKFLVPAAYLASFAIGVFMMDIPMKKMISNQFMSSTGIGILILIAGLFLFNTLIIDLVKNGKFDY